MVTDLYRRSDAPRAPLRIGLLLDSEILCAVFAEVVRDIQSSNFAKIELLILNQEARPEVGPRRPFWRRILRRFFDPQVRRNFLYDLYLRLDQRYQVADDPLAPVDCADLFNGIARISVRPLRKGFVHRFPSEAVEEIRTKDLDVLLRFGFNILRGEILQSARHGVWSYHHGDNEFYRGGPAGLWELAEQNPSSGVILQLLTEELDGGLILCKGVFQTANTLLMSRNRFAPYWGSAHFVLWKLNELHQLGWNAVRARACPSPVYRGKKKLYRAPTNAEMAKWLAPQLIKKVIRRFLRAARVAHWRIALRAGSHPLFESTSRDMSEFRWLDEPRGHFWADPCLFSRHEKTWLLFEDYLYPESRGVIACAEVGINGSVGPARVALDNGKHLSYPFVFEHEDTVYMIPESADTRTVPLYQAARFPDQWVLRRNLLDGHSMVDTTLFRDQEKWWMFTTVEDRGGSFVTLLLYYADSLEGDWIYHPANPISTDVRNGRNGGAVFRNGPRLFRISQDGSHQYGYSFTLNEILTLTPTDYEERPWRTIDPTWNPGLIGTHTYSHAGGIEVVDGCFLSRRHRVM